MDRKELEGVRQQRLPIPRTRGMSRGFLVWRIEWHARMLRMRGWFGSRMS